MIKILLKVIGLVLLTATLVFIFTPPVYSQAPTGTCCPGGLGTCVIGSYVQTYSYYSSGPCTE